MTGLLTAVGLSAQAEQTLWDLLRTRPATSPAQAALPKAGQPQPIDARPAQSGALPTRMMGNTGISQMQSAFGGMQGNRAIAAMAAAAGGATSTPYQNVPRATSQSTPTPAKPADKRTATMPAISAIAATPGAPLRLWDMLRAGSQAGELGAALFPTRPSAGTRAVGPEGEATDDATAQKPRGPRSGFMGMVDRVGQTVERVAKLTKTEVKATGSHVMGFHMENVSGSRDSYESATYYGRSMMGSGYANTNLDVRGKFLGIFNFETHYSNNIYGTPYENRLSLNYATKGLKLDAGDIQAGIRGNTLLDFSRSLKGISLAVDVAPGLKLSTLYSQTKAQTRTISINGANRSGPYYVYAGQVVDGSVKVRVNNKDMVLDQDYTLDPYTGELNFTNGLIIGELDTISVTFEVYGYNQSSGLLTGYRADLSMLKNVKLGLSYLAQEGAKASTKTVYKTEQFYGYNNAATPYQLDYSVDMLVTKDSNGTILTSAPRYPMTVTVNGVAQVYDVDYLVDPTLWNRVFFKAAIPSTNIIRIAYVPLVTTDTIGDRNVMGLDAGFALGKKSNIVAEMAASRYVQGSNTVRGAAWQVRGDSKFLRDSLSWSWTVKSINPNFTAIESPGFKRNEAGFTTSLDYRANSALKFNATIENTRRPTYSYTSTSTSSYATTSGRDRYNQLNLGANWTLGKTGQLVLIHNDMRTRSSTGAGSTYGTDSLTFTFGFKALTGDLALSRSNNSSKTLTSSTTGTTSSTAYSTSALTSRLSLNYRASDRLQFQSGASLSTIDGNNGTNQAQDISLAADYAPAANLRLRANFQLQNSGSNSIYSTSTTTTTTTTSSKAAAVTALTWRDPWSNLIAGAPASRVTTYSGYTGLGGYGNYSGGLGYGTSYSTANYSGNSRTISLQTSYQPLPPLTLEMQWSTSKSLGDYLYNSNRNDVTFSVGYALGERLSANTAFSIQKVDYSGSSGGTSSNMMFVNLRGRPVGKLTATLNYQYMRTSNSATSSSSTTSLYSSGGTNLNSMMLRLEYPIWRGNSLYWQFENSDSSGYLAATQRGMSMGIAFDLNRGLQFTLGWRNQQYLSRGSSSGTSSNYDYKVNSLDADLNVHF